jgi:hypothetical protein
MARRRSALLLVSALLLLCGVVLSSNMAFRHTADFSVTGRDYWLSLPYHNDYETAEDLCQAIGPAAILVSRFDTEARSRVDWTCPFGSNFPLTPGEGFFVRVSAPSSPVFSGAHDPNLRIPLGGFRLALRDYIISLPYHGVARSASDLCGEIPNAILISRFDTENGYSNSWTCPFGHDFPLDVGMAVRVRVSEAGEGFVPAHY